jgi:hypothetical protein
MAGRGRSASAQSKWHELRLIASVSAIGLAVSGAVIYASGRTELTDQSVAYSRACQEADHARVAQLVHILERNQPTDAAVLERAVYSLNIARRHCLYGWSDIAEEQYAWLNQWLEEHR